MAGTYTKEIIAKNQRKIVRDFEGIKKFVDAISYHKAGWKKSTWDCIYILYKEGQGYVATIDMYNYLKRTIPNFKEDSYVYKDGTLKSTRVADVYASMMATAGTKLYESLKEGKNPLTAKKKIAKKTVVKRK